MKAPHRASDPATESIGSSEDRAAKFGTIVQHPIRIRMLGILRHSGPYTQRELGRRLSLSNAAIHYHLNVLLKADLVKLEGTRAGPNSITEKLFEINHEKWAAFVRASEEKNADLGFYLEYVLAWIQERNREGLELLKKADYAHPFMAGSYVVRASYEEIIALKRKVHQLLADFHERHDSAQNPSEQAFAIIFSMVPSREEDAEQSQNLLESEPGRVEPLV